MTTQHPSDFRLSDRALGILSIVLVLGTVPSVLDTTIINVAIHTLATDFHASVIDVQWVITGYLLAYVAAIPLTGWASQRFGARRVWIFAVALFLLGSVLCTAAWSLPSLVGFRVLQGLGGGMILPITTSMLTRAAGPDRIGRAITSIALPAQLAPILGPVIGGALVDAANWRWLFLVNVPLCLAALVIAPRALPREDAARGHRLDVVGYLLLAPGIVAMAYGISRLADEGGFSAAEVWAPLAGGAILLIAFVVYSLRAKLPALIDVRLFARRSFGVSSLITLASGFSIYASLLLVPLFFQVVRHQTVLQTGLLMIPQGVGSILMIFLYRRIEKLVSARLLVIVGVVAVVLGTLPFALGGPHTDAVLLLAALFARGGGIVAINIPILSAAYASLDRAEVPRASAAFNVVQRVGAPFGTAVIAVILSSMAPAGIPTTAQTVAAFSGAFWWTIAFSAVPLVLAFLLPSARKGAVTAAPTAAGTSVEPAGQEDATLAQIPEA